jgi:hypothetical protein
MVVVPMLVLEVPFMKWAHLMYRPLALYLRQVKATAAATAVAPSPAGGGELEAQAPAHR